MAGMFGGGKVCGKFGISFVLSQTLASQILAYKWYPYVAELIPLAKYISFGNSPNILAILYCTHASDLIVFES